VKHDQLLGHLAVAGAYTIFGLNIVFCKDIANAEAVSPMLLFTLRAIGAATLFWLLSLFLPKEPIAKGDIGLIILASCVGLVVPQLTFLKAMTLSATIDASVMHTLSPIFTMFFAFFFAKEPITWKKALGVAISFGGVLLLIFNSVHATGGVEHTAPLGFVMLVLNSLSFALYLGAFRKLISRYSVVTFMKWTFLFALLLSLPFSTRELVTTDFAALPHNVLWEIGFLVFFATFVAYFLIPYGQKRIRPTLVSMYTYLQPIIAAVVSIITGLDILTWQKLLATLLVFAGVYLVMRSRAAAV
jgi:drug/metabolite transporter (DMT)-like permease